MAKTERFRTPAKRGAAHPSGRKKESNSAPKNLAADLESSGVEGNISDRSTLDSTTENAHDPTAGSSGNNTPTAARILEELKLAILLAEFDDSNHAFVKHPYLFAMHKNDPEWIDGIRNSIVSQSFELHFPVPVEVPKADWHTRPGLRLRLEDLVIYHHTVLSFREEVYKQLLWSQQSEVRFSNYMSQKSNKWFEQRIGGWKAFRDKAIQLLNCGYSEMLATDISGYYENVGIRKLTEDLHGLGVSGAVRQSLSTLLNRWAGPRERGIPQAYSPSHVLGELYLDSIDRILVQEGIKHIRYMDDYRVFGKNQNEVRSALQRLSFLLRARGLNVQTSKTRIYNRAEAIAYIDGIKYMIAEVRSAVRSAASNYGTPDESDDDDEGAPSPAVVRRVWSKFMQSSESGVFDKSVFHYLLHQMSKREIDDGVDYCLETLVERPEETNECLQYLRLFQSKMPKINDFLVAMLPRASLPVPYQEYQIVRHFTEHRILDDRVKKYCRHMLHSSPAHHPARAWAIYYLGQMGIGHDHNSLLEMAPMLDPLERAGIVIALTHANESLRNYFCSRMNTDAAVVRRAISFAKGRPPL